MSVIDLDVQALDAAWRASWGAAEPAANSVLSRFPDRVVAFRHVSDPSGYVSLDDLEEALRRYRWILGHMLAESGQDEVVVVTCSWSAGPGPAPRDAAVQRHMPRAVHWRSHDRATEPGYSSWEHCYASAVEPDDPSLRTLLCSALGDAADGVVLLDVSGTWAVHPGLRSMIVFARDPLLLRRLADAHPGWSHDNEFDPPV